ncbi:hypothetical protein [Bdellovibrio sp. HCB209]|uniref:hypothetical protein n=1 Tax=Bdellovibrio sp. HCB209 TaxID=3394354 RepID=UPI0039B47235
MSKTIGMITALIAMSFLSACATTSSQHETQSMISPAAETWEVSEVPFIQAVKKAPTKSEIVENKVKKNHKQN